MKACSQNLSTLLCGLGCSLVLAALPAFAHHALGAEYATNRAVTLNGKVTKVDWSNPHARFYIDVKDQSGQVTSWELQLGSPNGLMRRGWSSQSLKPGNVVTVDGFIAKDRTRLVSATAVHLADGSEVFGGTAR
jgi:hypothetical protein